MKLDVSQIELNNALNCVIDAVQRNSTMAILNNIAIEAKSGKITVIATDMDIEARHTFEANIEQDGAITTPAKKLSGIIKGFSTGAQVSLSINPDNHQLNLSARRSRYVLPTLPIAEYPNLLAQKYDCTFDLPAQHMLNLIDKTEVAIAPDEVRHYLRGIYFTIVESNLRAVTTDGHRLALCDTNLPSLAAEAMPSFIMPEKTCQLIKKILSTEIQEMATLSVSETSVHLSYGATSITSRVIDGTYPDYDRIIPKDNPYTLEVDKEPLERAVKRITHISDEKITPTKITLVAETLSLSTPQEPSTTASGTEELDCHWTGKDGFMVGYNSRYLLDILKNIKSKKIRIKLDGNDKPALIQDPEDENTLFLLMGMRVR